MARPTLKVKKVPVTFFIFEDKVKEFIMEVKDIAARHNGAEKIIQAQSFAEKAKGKKQAAKPKKEAPFGLRDGIIADEVVNHSGRELTKKLLTALVNNPTGKPHPFYKPGDPKENTGAFFLKYGVMTYQEINKK